MTEQDFIALRQQLPMSDDELARILGVTQQLITKWGDGRVAIAERFDIVLQSLLYATRSDSVLATSGLPRCPKADQVTVTARGRELTAAELLDLRRHRRNCAICKARDSYVKERLGTPEFARQSGGPVLRLLAWVMGLMELLPEWARPAALGAALLFGFVGVRSVFALLFALLAGPRTPGDVLKELAVPFVAALGGAAGGLAYSLLAKPPRRIPIAGPYLAGVVTVCAYMAALEWIIGAMGGGLITSKSDAVVFLCVSIFFGLVVGQMWFKASDEAPVHGTAS